MSMIKNNIYIQINNIYNKIVNYIIKNNKRVYYENINEQTNLNLMGLLLRFYPNVINKNNQYEYNYFIKYFTNIMKDKDNIYNKLIKLNVISQHFNLKYLPYTGINMILDLNNINVNNNNIDYDEHDIYDIINSYTEVGYFIKINDKSFGVCGIYNDEIKKLCYLLNDKIIEFQNKNDIAHNEYIMNTFYIEPKINLIKKNFNWNKKIYDEYIYIPFENLNVSIGDIIKMNECIRNRP
jgi:hypothetical protein